MSAINTSGRRLPNGSYRLCSGTSAHSRLSRPNKTAVMPIERSYHFGDSEQMVGLALLAYSFQSGAESVA